MILTEFSNPNETTLHRVDRANSVLRGVKLCGVRSKNGRRYSRRALEQAAEQYKGLVVHLNHPAKTNPGQPRDVRDVIGRVFGAPTIRDDGIYGHVQLIASHPHAASIMETAEKMPSLIGFSHVVDAATRPGPDGAVVEAIDKVFSLDLVCSPATTNGLYEHQEHRTMTTSPVPSLNDREALRRYVFSEADAPVVTTPTKRGRAESDMPVVADAPTPGDDDNMTHEAAADIVASIIDTLAGGGRPNSSKIGELRKVIRWLRSQAKDETAQESVALTATDRERLKRLVFEQGGYYYPRHNH